ncbi:multicopper oxidase family protein [Aeromonas taiwanensis]|uniref:multicopper oxidase family protein n=1 Tax=Aeromonas taiwanensis TaxID=633417 RepID=UPI003BA22978
MNIKHHDVDTDKVSVSNYPVDSAAVVDEPSALKSNKKITRRDFLRSTGILYAASAMIDTKHARAGDDDDEDSPPPPVVPPSPSTIPWTIHLPTEINYLAPTRNISPAPTKVCNKIGRLVEAGREPHQLWEYFNSKYNLMDYTYEIYAVQFDEWTYNEAYPKQRHWGYQADPDVAKLNQYDLLKYKIMPSVVVAAKYGQPIICRIHNNLPLDHDGFGTPEISTHLHNLHTASESDGYPGDYYSEEIAGPTLSYGPGVYKDHLYANLKAGFTDLVRWKDGKGDPTEALGTLFYHDHTDNFTAPNVYRGLAGFYLLFDERDTGNENDGSADALRLPSGNYDYPFSIGDRRFDSKGMLYYDQLHPEGVLGDKIIINGHIEPVWDVVGRRYRMRFLNSGPSRFYDLAIVDKNNVIQSFTYIANDGNLLKYPLMNTKSIRLGSAERADIIMDFSRYSTQGKPVELYLVNRLEQTQTSKPGKVRTPGQRIMKIIVSPGIVDDPSVELKDGMLLRNLPGKFSKTEDELRRLNIPVRRWVFENKSGLWVVNDKLFDATKAAVTVKKGASEIWEFVNPSGGWAHPIHVHLEEGRILSKVIDGIKVPVPPHEQGRKDVYVLEPNSKVRVYLEFRDFTGKYVIHCHNLIHEDHVMMVRWDVI